MGETYEKINYYIQEKKNILLFSKKRISIKRNKNYEN